MGYEVLIETLLKEGKNISQERIEKAKKESEAILRSANENAEQLVRTRREECGREIEAGRAKILNQARMERRRILLEARHRVLEKVFRKTMERLEARIRQADGGEPSRRFWRRRVEEALPERGAGGLKGYLHAGAPLDLEKVLREKGVMLERTNDPALWGGFRLVSADESAGATNSFPSRLEKCRTALILELQSSLFEIPEGS